MWALDGDVIQELEQWITSTAKLRSLIDKANWADAGSKAFAEHLCEDLQQRIQRCKAHLVKKTYTDTEKIWPLDAEVIQELEQWSDSMAKLRSLVDKANCADAGSKDFAEHLCGDLHQRIQRCKAHFAKELEIAQGKRLRLQLQVNDPPAAEEIRKIAAAQPGRVQNVVVVVSESQQDSNSVHLSRHSFVRFGSSTSVGHINQSQQKVTENIQQQHDSRGVDGYFTEEEIRKRSLEISDHEDMKHLLRVFSMGGGGGGGGGSPSPDFNFDDHRSHSTDKAVDGWLKIKAAMRWGLFIRKKAAERRAQLVELDAD